MLGRPASSPTPPSNKSESELQPETAPKTPVGKGSSIIASPIAAAADSTKSAEDEFEQMWPDEFERLCNKARFESNPEESAAADDSAERAAAETEFDRLVRE
eukprot:561177-Alexandrium_andersonii.AAC.1